MSSFKLNNWSEVKKARKAIEEGEPYLSRAMESIWPLIVEAHKKASEPHKFRLHDEVYQRDGLESGDADPLEKFLHMINFGLYPPPEIMIWIANCFNTYFQKNGELTLDEVFFGRGNYALKKRREAKYQLFDLFLEARDDLLIDRKPVATQSQLVEGYYKWLDENLENIDKPDDFDSFLKSYRRWKNKTDK